MNEMTHLEDLADRIEPRQASNVLLWVVLGFVAVFVLWASLTELDRTVAGWLYRTTINQARQRLRA